MPRITVRATEYPVPLPTGGVLQPGQEMLADSSDMFINRRLAAGELVLVADPAAAATEG